MTTQADIARRIALFMITRGRPHPGQRFRHGWIPVDVASASQAQGSNERAEQIRKMEKHVEKLRREGPPRYERDPERYVQTDLHARIHGLPIGARIPKRPEKLGYESLPSGHWRDPATGDLHGEYGPVGWTDDLRKAEAYLADLKDPAYGRDLGEDATALREERLRQARRVKRLPRS